MIVANHLRDEATMLASWAHDRRVPYTRCSEESPPDVPGPMVPPLELDAA